MSLYIPRLKALHVKLMLLCILYKPYQSPMITVTTFIYSISISVYIVLVSGGVLLLCVAVVEVCGVVDMVDVEVRY